VKIECLGSTYGLYGALRGPEYDGAAAVELTYTGPAMDGEDAADLLQDLLFGSWEPRSAPVTLRLVNVVLEGQQVQVAAALGAAAARNLSLTLELVDCSILGNQFSMFGALAARSNLEVSVRLYNTRVTGNQFIGGLAAAAGGAAAAEITLVDSEVSGNNVAAAAALASAGAASIDVAAGGGAISRNLVSGAALLLAGGPASAYADVGQAAAEGNLAQGAALPLTELPLVSRIVETVLYAGGWGGSVGGWVNRSVGLGCVGHGCVGAEEQKGTRCSLLAGSCRRSWPGRQPSLTARPVLPAASKLFIPHLLRPPIPDRSVRRQLVPGC
jgi:hypothetical protein